MNDNTCITLSQGANVYSSPEFTKKKLSCASRQINVVIWSAILGTALLLSSLFSISYTVSGSMVPTLSVGEINVMRHVFGENDLNRGDIVLFDPVTEANMEIANFLGNGEKLYIKRLIGLPGETIRIENDVVYINGAPLDEPYAAYPQERTVMDADRNMEEFTIPEGHYFFMGDNRDNSYDSRYGVGVIPYDNIVKKVMFHFTSVSAHIVGTDDDSLFI